MTEHRWYDDTLDVQNATDSGAFGYILASKFVTSGDVRGSAGSKQSPRRTAEARGRPDPIRVCSA